MRDRLARLLACALPHLAVWAVMLFALAPQAQAVWECGGRACGSTTWTCCCSSGGLQCDQTCIDGIAQDTGGALQNIAVASAVSSHCHCQMVVDSDPAKSLPSASLSWPAPDAVVCVLAARVRFEAPRPSARLHHPEVRGPPPGATCLAFPSLRAPPLA